MKKKVRIGVRVRLPFGLFPHAGIYKTEMTEADIKQASEKFFEFIAFLRFIRLDSIADQFVFEVA